MIYCYKIGPKGAIKKDSKNNWSQTGLNNTFTTTAEDWVGLEQYMDYVVSAIHGGLYMTFPDNVWNAAIIITEAEFDKMAETRMNEIEKEYASQGYSDHDIYATLTRSSKFNYWGNLYRGQSFHNGIVNTLKPSLPPQVIAIAPYGLAHGNCSDEPRGGTVKYTPPDCECGLDKAGCGGDHSSWCAKGIFLKGNNHENN